jgi:ligand-binding sensor domain-containing protein
VIARRRGPVVVYIPVMRILGALSISAAVSISAAAQSPSRDWRPEDRTVIGDFSRVTSIATSIDRVYVTSPTSLVIWQPHFQTWSGPFESPSRGILNGVFAALVDPLDQSLWLARPNGWVHYQPELRIWDEGAVPGSVTTIAFDESDPASGLHIRTSSGWLLVPRGSTIAIPGRGPAQAIRPTTVEEVLRQAPTLQINAAGYLLDSRMQPVRLTAAARAADNQGWYVGTSGLGLFYLQDAAAIPERVPFGLPSPYVGAVTSWPGGLWVATNRTAQTDAAFTFVSSELREFRTVHGLPATGTPFTRVLELAGRGKALWAATDFGLARVDPNEQQIDLFDQSRGLPDSRVFDVVGREGSVVVGTAHGLARMDDALQVTRVAPRFAGAAYAVFPAGDSVWVGTPNGLLLALPGQEDLVRPRSLASASLQDPVFGLSTLGDTLVALTRDHIIWRDPRSGAWSIGPNLSALLGRLRRFIPDGAGFWVAGERGVGFVRLSGALVRALRDGDLPGPANDLAVDRDHLWVATENGLVRFRLDAIRP